MDKFYVLKAPSNYIMKIWLMLYDKVQNHK
jgi:hypothetical protein